MSAFTIVHLDDLERPFPKWALARKSLDVSSFGLNVVELPPGETIPEHDEVERDQEEVFVMWIGDVTMVIDGEDHPAPAGTFVRLDPEPQRTIRNDGTEMATVLILSAPRTSGYEPMGWA
ncbi:MAG: cupin domain-containing protein [Actinobacteria bacterium]|nr:cupin domain-containing protein [Actinomycetota bacterium]